MRVRNVLTGCLVFVILSASSPQLGEASASSSSVAGVDETFGYAPPSQAARRAAARDAEDRKKGKIGERTGERTGKEPASPLKKRSAELFEQDGDEEVGEKSANTMMWVNMPKSEVQEGEQGGAFAGRNRKKLKHRRLDSVEVHMRKLREKGIERGDGTLDEDAMMRLFEAQAEQEVAKEQGYAGGAPMRVWTMEDLDREYPTEEGNRRLGLVEEGAVERKEVKQLRRWEKSSHFVEMRRSAAVGAKNLALPDEVVNYIPSTQRMTLFVEGSTGVRYAIEDVHAYDTVEQLKAKIWKMEREYRYAGGSRMKTKDTARGFKIEDQDVLLNGEVLAPDSTTLKSLNVTAMDVMVLSEKPKPVSPEELEAAKTFFADMVWEREREKAWALESDSDEQDSDYRAMKECYLAAGEETFEQMRQIYPLLNETNKVLLKGIPNLGYLPPWNSTEQSMREMEKAFDRLTDETLERMVEEEIRKVDEDLSMPITITPEMHAQKPIEVAQEAFEELIKRQNDPDNPFPMMVHLFKDEGEGKYSYVEGDRLVDGEVRSPWDSKQRSRRGVGGIERERARKGEGFEQEEKRDEADVETFSLPEDLMEEAKACWFKTYAEQYAKGGAKAEVMSESDSQYHDSPVQFSKDFGS